MEQTVSSQQQNRTLCLPREPTRPASSSTAPRRAERGSHGTRPFAGELDVPGKRGFVNSNKCIATSVTGCTHFLPGTRNVFGLNYQQTLKTAEHVRRSQKENYTMLNKRELPTRLIDAWGNMKRRDMLTTQVCANMYLRTAHSDNDIELHCGIGKPTGVPAVKEGRPVVKQHMTEHRPRVVMPPRVMGHTGHLGNSRHHVGVGYNRILMDLHPQYAQARNYVTHQCLADKVPVVPA